MGGRLRLPKLLSRKNTLQAGRPADAIGGSVPSSLKGEIRRYGSGDGCRSSSKARRLPRERVDRRDICVRAAPRKTILRGKQTRLVLECTSRAEIYDAFRGGGLTLRRSYLNTLNRVRATSAG